MPLKYQKIWSESHKAGVWKIEEPTSYFLDRLVMDDVEMAGYSRLSDKRQKEWLASRLLICQLMDNYHTSIIHKDSFGKPFVKDSHINISISHSYDHVAAILSPQKAGIDVQKRVDKITRIAHKYLNLEELHAIPSQLSTDVLLIQWGAKEALYKAYGRKSLEYREHIKVLLEESHFNQLREASPYPLKYEGYIKKDTFYESYELRTLLTGEYFLTYSIKH